MNVAHAAMPLLFRHAVSHRQLQRILRYFHLINYKDNHYLLNGQNRAELFMFLKKGAQD